MSAAWLVLLVASLPPTPASTLEAAAAEFTTFVVDRRFAPPVGVFVDGSSTALPRAFASLVAARLSSLRLAPVVIEAPDAAEAEQRARAMGVVTLARLTLVLERGSLTVRGDVLSTRVNFWSAQVPTRTGPAAVVTLSLPADAQTLTLSGLQTGGPAAPLALRVSSLGRLAQLPAALAVGDLDGDRHAEVAVLFADRLAIYGELKLQAQAELTQRLAARPTREPFGLVSLAPGRVVAWSMRREHGESWGFSNKELQPAGANDTLSLGALTLKPEPGFNRFAADLSWAGKPLALPVGPQTVSVSGEVVLMVFADGAAAVSRGGVPSSRVLGLGAGSALADLDGDGTPEVVATLSRTSGEADEVKVLALSAFEALQARGGTLAESTPLWQQPLHGRAVVAAAGDLDGDGLDEVVLGLWAADGSSGELVLLRGSGP